ncbi:epididymal secretory glutathione peroxidase isoform X2 [Nomascus leucogenys]|uniref:Glutathione peroxidase 5 n=1 Tax=Nomascus leucogenys TaxID=61853 RepID=A0A2I3GFP2_NOMLE|nr:epididymal secretory glutathione peroxidase isoform X2 [Nomascus leucogenys]
MTTQLRVIYLLPLLLACFVQTSAKQEKMKMDCHKDEKATIYDYEAIALNKNEYVSFKQYVGKHILFVNVATYCGLTAQYPGMSVQGEDLYLISSFLRKVM